APDEPPGGVPRAGTLDDCCDCRRDCRLRRLRAPLPLALVVGAPRAPAGFAQFWPSAAALVGQLAAAAGARVGQGELEWLGHDGVSVLAGARADGAGRDRHPDLVALDVVPAVAERGDGHNRERDSVLV